MSGQKAGSSAASSPDTEVTAKAKRRSFGAAYKKRILAEVDAAAGTGSIGELLRREGLYSSTLSSWRKERDAAVHCAFSQKRGPEPKHYLLAAENEKLRRQNVRLQEELRKAEIIIDVQKKVAMLLGHPVPPLPDSENS
jgi:transposase-like protein